MSETKVESEVGLNLEATFDIKNKYNKFFEDARKLAEKNCYETRVLYTDESKPPPDFIDQEKQLNDDKYIEQKDKYMADLKMKNLLWKKKKIA